MLNLRFVAEGNRTVSLQGLSGNTIRQFELTGNGSLAAMPIDVADLQAGVYFLKIQSPNGETKVLKFVKL